MCLTETITKYQFHVRKLCDKPSPTPGVKLCNRHAGLGKTQGPGTIYLHDSVDCTANTVHLKKHLFFSNNLISLLYARAR